LGFDAIAKSEADEQAEIFHIIDFFRNKVIQLNVNLDILNEC
jgi:hypothetical protein